MRYDIHDWYWTVASEPTEVWSSKRGVAVPKNDAAYLAWLDAGGKAQIIPSLTDLREMFANVYPAGMLATYLAARRFDVETRGISIEGMTIATDRQSQAMINGAVGFLSLSPASAVKFKTLEGFIDLDLQALQAVAIAVAMHVQKCFAKEAETLRGIEAGSITSRHEIDLAILELS